MKPLHRRPPPTGWPTGVGAPTPPTPLELPALMERPVPTDVIAPLPRPEDVTDRPHSNAELARALAYLDVAGGGRVDVRRIGVSREGRPLWYATVGTGPVPVLYVTQQHGDEPLGTEAALRTLRLLGLDDGAWAQTVRSQVTLGVVVRANPDGHERRRRCNHDPDASPEHGESGHGYDINRYHHPALSPRDNPVPEAAALQRLWAAFRPALLVDFHMQGRYDLADGSEITASVTWPISPAVPAATLTRSKQSAVAAFDALTAAGGVVSKFPGDVYDGIARNAYAIRGSASVLVELSDIPGRERFQIDTACRAMLALAGAAGSGALAAVDPSRADAIPPRGPERRDALPEFPTWQDAGGGATVSRSDRQVAAPPYRPSSGAAPRLGSFDEAGVDALGLAGDPLPGEP